ncbi:unnamed protein product, partial [Timema podura]|nr:unnamed protein product [Timema podura]
VQSHFIGVGFQSRSRTISTAIHHADIGYPLCEYTRREKTILSTPDLDSNLDLLVISSLLQHESRALDHAAIEAGCVVIFSQQHKKCALNTFNKPNIPTLWLE